MVIEDISAKDGQILKGLKKIKPKIYNDKRGSFHESWNKKDFADILGKEIEFVQDNESTSKIGVLRGLHYQLKQKPQSKLVRVTQGRIYDVAVDLRRSSDTFLKWAGIYLDDKLNEQLWIPSGFAHGFLTLSNFAKLNYKVTGYWSSVLEKTLLWNDSNINIEWPFDLIDFDQPILSNKDEQGLNLKEIIKKNFVF